MCVAAKNFVRDFMKIPVENPGYTPGYAYGTLTFH